MTTSDVYYVYVHTCPITNKIVYVGKGKGGRAWDVTRCRNGHKDHQNWMIDLIEKGFLPSDWVNIIQRNLSEKEAFQIEKEELHEIGVTLFNRQSGERQHQAKLSNKQALEVFKLRNEGLTHRAIAEKFGVSRPAISMILSGRQWKTITKEVRFERQQ